LGVFLVVLRGTIAVNGRCYYIFQNKLLNRQRFVAASVLEHMHIIFAVRLPTPHCDTTINTLEYFANSRIEHGRNMPPTLTRSDKKFARVLLSLSSHAAAENLSYQIGFQSTN
jgi:hypothetical protein